MESKNRIFAKKNTNEKVVWLVPDSGIKSAMGALNKKFGGSWVYIQAIEPREVVLFTDQFTYKGFDNRDGSYCSLIVEIKIQ